MKCVKKGEEIQRVSNEEAADMVKAGWSYCGKEGWKVIRDANKKKNPEKGPETAEKSEAPVEDKKGQKKSKYKQRSERNENKNQRRDGGRERRDDRFENRAQSEPPKKKMTVNEILDTL